MMFAHRRPPPMKHTTLSKFGIGRALFPTIGLLLAAAGAGCDAAGTDDQTGAVTFDLRLGTDIQIEAVQYDIAGPNAFQKAGSLNVGQSTTVSGVIPGLPAGAGYALTLTATDTGHKL